ncbi:hypothetical protein FGL95_18645 [Nocardiaceae bacterium YC2-7]|uniref:Alpha/beta hydrolase domain-containing protein n=1 Tax=Antrihabitans stalactiti TaxID=2584121 RepID=A0A848KDS5_9NOCA|nr:alpha/beta hydrolase domain-containing protein [Antrihabitans stalactiti]NMN97063.1 hypothetical protein [Antrihabitans stalactiti]
MLLAAVSGPDLAANGYSEEEYLATGTATSFRAAGPLTAEGRFDLELSGETAEFATRVVVRRPIDPDAFNGTLVVEWLNVSSGRDAAPDYTYLARELIRSGYAWAGVSAQWAGVEGGNPTIAVPNSADRALTGLAGIDPKRYGDLHHPGDAFCYDIFGQVAHGLETSPALAGLTVVRKLAVGESQAAIALSMYYNGIQPLSNTFDGFLIHSRGGAVAPLGTAGTGIALRAALREGTPTRLRDDVAVPAIVVQTETDLFGHLAYYPARQEDSDYFRLWEIAGAAHADKFQIGPFESILECPLPVNRGQQSFVVRAALRALDRWASDGQRPPSAPRMQVVAGETEFALDDNGNVVGGVRTPAVDAPTTILSGAPAPGASPICALFGTTTPLPEARLRALYASAAAYLARYRAAVDAAIAAGFVLADDRAELLAEAQPDLVSW